jgi:uncharacterized membrane protein
MVEDKKILVSSTIEDKGLLKLMRVAAAGLVDAPLEFTFRTVKKFEALPKVSDHFEEAKFDASKNTLFLHLSAMGYHVKMTLKLNFHEEEKHKTIQWESIEGGFRGMKGTIDLMESDPRHTEMSMRARYEDKNLPLPRVLMGIGLEFVTQRVAGTMREYIEKAYKD